MKTVDDERLTGDPADPRRPERRRLVATFVVVGVAIAVIALALVATSDDDGGGNGATGTTSITSGPTSVPTTAPTVDRSTAIWPAAGSSTRYDDPVDAARAFAASFLRFEGPIVGDFQQGDARSGEVEIRPTAIGPITTIMLRQLSNETSWSVLGAATANIEVTGPSAGDEISSPVRVAGRALAFEGNVQVEVREDSEPGAIGAGFVTGGGDIMRPFDGTISFETARSPYGALVFFTESAKNGEVWEAAAFRVRLVSTDIDAAACGTYLSPRFLASTAQMEVKAYFNCDADGGGTSLFPVYRLVPRSTGVLRASLDALLAGPNANERAAGIGSWFSNATAGMLRLVTIRDGHAVLDFDDLRPVIPNASTSAGSARLLSQLDTTVFQFRSVTSVEYRLEGNCEDFNEWLQFGGCTPRTRSEISSD